MIESFLITYKCFTGFLGPEEDLPPSAVAAVDNFSLSGRRVLAGVSDESSCGAGCWMDFLTIFIFYGVCRSWLGCRCKRGKLPFRWEESGRRVEGSLEILIVWSDFKMSS